MKVHTFMVSENKLNNRFPKTHFWNDEFSTPYSFYEYSTGKIKVNT